MEVQTIKETQIEANFEMENLGKGSRISDKSITIRIQERISSVENTIEDIDTPAKENSKYKNLLTQNIQEIQET